MKKDYLAVIGDIIDSRDIENREEIQQQLQATIDGLDNANLLTPYNIMLGDELQAVYESPGGLFRDILSLFCGIYPAKIRFAVAIGEISTKIDKKNTSRMDGPVFYKARDCLERLKKSDYLFAIEKNENYKNYNYSLILISHLMHKWQKNRFLILHALMLGKEKSQIAKDLGISLTSVYKNIDDGDLQTIINIFEVIENKLESDMNG